MNPRLLALSLSLVFVLSSFGGELSVAWLTPAQPPVPGARGELELAVLNRSAAPQTLPAPARLSGVLRVDGRAVPVELRAVPASVSAPSIAPGAFEVLRYSLAWPDSLVGPATLEVSWSGLAPLSLAAAGAPARSASESNASASPAHTSLPRGQPAALAIQRTFADRLSTHEPIYFIYGTEAPGAKFQLSFKYKLIGFSADGEEQPVRTLQFGFTQRSLWDVDGVSSPFYDTSYMPEVIFESLAQRPETSTGITWLGYQVAFKHESNGRDGPISRSLNGLSLRGAVAFGSLDGWRVIVIPELFAYVGGVDDNPAIKDYRGYGQLRVVAGRNDGPSLMTTAWAGKDFDHPSVQLDFTVPLQLRMLDFKTYLLVQYFDGYGESLRDYTARSRAWRAGLSLVR